MRGFPSLAMGDSMTADLANVGRNEALILVHVKDSLNVAGFEVVAAHEREAGNSGTGRDAERIPKQLSRTFSLAMGQTAGKLVAMHANSSLDMPVIYMSGGSNRDLVIEGVPDSV